MKFSIFKTKLSFQEKAAISKEVKEDLDKLYKTLNEPYLKEILELCQQGIELQRQLDKQREISASFYRNCDSPNPFHLFAMRMDDAFKNCDHNRIKVLMDDYEGFGDDTKLSIDLYRKQN